MSDVEALTPRVILFRHGETEWAKSGRFTGVTEINLTPEGVAQVSSAASKLVGAGQVIDPSRLAHIFVSPRKRARRTFELLLLSDELNNKAVYTERIAEWNYGDYEGLNKQEISALRERRGLDAEWDIWSDADGCEGGESQLQVTKRLDEFISWIKENQRPTMRGERPGDILIVAHGLILRVLAKRWLNLPIDHYLPMLFPPGAVAVLSYKNNDIDEPAIQLGLSMGKGT